MHEALGYRSLTAVAFFVAVGQFALHAEIAIYRHFFLWFVTPRHVTDFQASRFKRGDENAWLIYYK
jgi:hypothetical protein